MRRIKGTSKPVCISKWCILSVLKRDVDIQKNTYSGHMGNLAGLQQHFKKKMSHYLEVQKVI